MDYTQILQVGGPTAAIAIVGYFIIRMFLAHLKDKDERVALLVSNHLHSNTTALQKLHEAVRELTIFIKKSNGK